MEPLRIKRCRTSYSGSESEKSNDDPSVYQECKSPTRESIAEVTALLQAQARALETKKKKSQKEKEEEMGSDHVTSDSEDSEDEREAEFLQNLEDEMQTLPDEHNGTIFIYGDSLSWGMAHNYTGRYKKPWPRIVSKELERFGVRVTDSALCSRTSKWDDTGDNSWMTGSEPHFFNGSKHFPAEFMGVKDPECLIILLGTNDLKERIRIQTKVRGVENMAQEIARNVAQIGVTAQEIHRARHDAKQAQKTRGAKNKEYNELKVILVSPPLVVANMLSEEMGYDVQSVLISKEFSKCYAQVCKKHKFVHVACPAEVDMDRSVDGVHITEDANQHIAQAVLDELFKQYSTTMLSEENTERKPKSGKKRRHSSSRNGSNSKSSKGQ